jgi:hypothetical protein
MSKWTKERMTTSLVALDKSESEPEPHHNTEQVWCLRTIRFDLREALSEIERLQSIVGDYENATKGAMDEACDCNERHCTCVPLLRAEVKRRQAELEEAARLIRAHLHYPVDVCPCENCQSIRDFLERHHEPQAGEPSKERQASDE